MAEPRTYEQVLDEAVEAYANAVRNAKTPADHRKAAQAIGDNIDIDPSDQGLVMAAGLSMVVKSLKG